ncbi:hypothetical protein [Amorphus sp. 3PC139-8]|uniref:hypothetical protein n=1 Tax=Amorphus sp. 3PC139-8 TaxID=2735676 RepID=UPI00345C9C57
MTRERAGKRGREKTEKQDGDGEKGHDRALAASLAANSSSVEHRASVMTTDQYRSGIPFCFHL